MARIESWFDHDLQNPVKVHALNGMVFSLDNRGNLIGVRVYNNGDYVSLSGSVVGYCMLENGVTVQVAGTRSENTAYIVLPQSAYAVPGTIRIVVKLTDENVVTTLLAVVGTVYRSRTDTVVNPSSQIITDWSQQIASEMQAVEDASAAQDIKINNEQRAGHVVVLDDLVVGGIGETHPETPTQNTTRIRVRGLTHVYKGMGISFVPGLNAQKIICMFYDEEKTRLMDTGWISAPYYAKAENDGYIGIVFARLNDTDIGVSNYDATTIITTVPATRFNQEDYEKSKETNKNIFDFGQNWEISHGGTTICKSNHNFFKIGGEHSGTYRYILLSSDNGQGASSWTDFPVNKLDVKLTKGNVYRVVIEKVMSDSETAALSISMHLVMNSNGSVVDDVLINLSPLTNGESVIESEFVAKSSLYGVAISLTTRNYNGAFRIYITDISEQELKKRIITDKRIYRDMTAERASINSSTGKIDSNYNCRTVFFQCDPNSIYVIKKIPGGRFCIGESATEPSIGTTLDKYVMNNTASEIEYTTKETTHWLAAFVYYSSTDSGITGAEMCDSVEIYKRTVNFTDEFIEPMVLEYGQRSIYDKYGNKPFYPSFRTYAGENLQGVGKSGNDYYVYCRQHVVRCSATGIKIDKDVTEFDHVMSVQSFGDERFLVTSAADYETEQETRKAYFYDFSTNSITDSFVPEVTGSLVFAYKTGETDYVIGTWTDQANMITFYSYDRTTSTATLLGTVDMLRRYFQGGSIVGQVLYASANNGASKKSVIHMINMSTMQIFNTMELIGFGESEGFEVYCDDNGNVFGYFADNTEKRVYKVRLS